jgi:hypothetical protein
MWLQKVHIVDDCRESAVTRAQRVERVLEAFGITTHILPPRDGHVGIETSSSRVKDIDVWYNE